MPLAKIKDITIGTLVDDGNWEDSFSSGMAEEIGKVLEFDKASGTEGWWEAKESWFRWHSSWLDFIEDTPSKGPTIQSPRRQAQIPDSDMMEAHKELDRICEDGEPMSAPEFLLRAVELFEERGEEYDVEEERSMGKTVVAFNAITGHNLKESEGWLLVQLLKDVRQWTKGSFHRDSAEDCISYAALKAEALAKNR